MARKTAVSKVSKYIDVPVWNEKGKLEAGSTVSGYYIDKEDFTTKFGEGCSFILETTNGLVKLMGQSDIKNKFVDIPAGAMVWVTFDGLVETSKGAKKGYTVEYDDEDIKALEEIPF